MSVQVVAHGFGDEDVQAMVTLVDSASLTQVDCVLDWDDALTLGRQLVSAADRLRPAAS